VIINNEADKWFKGGNLVNEAAILVIGFLALPITEILNIPGIIKILKRWWAKRNENTVT